MVKKVKTFCKRCNELTGVINTFGKRYCLKCKYRKYGERNEDKIQKK